jgi:hypothetical protein
VLGSGKLAKAVAACPASPAQSELLRCLPAPCGLSLGALCRAYCTSLLGCQLGMLMEAR